MRINFYLHDMTLEDAKRITLERIKSIEDALDFECTDLQVGTHPKEFHADTEYHSPDLIKIEFIAWGCEQTFVVTADFSKKMENNNG